jgi:hypothetical protein
MRRLVVAITALLVALMGAVVGGYLLLFSASADRAARAVPDDAAVYVNVYLQPSAGQQLNLFGLLGQLRGFGDPAALGEKIDEVAQRLLGQARIDYAADLRPWLGAQVAVAAAPAVGGGAPQLLVLAAVKDAAAARAALPRVFASIGLTLTKETYRGHEVMTGQAASYALLDGLLVVATTPERLRAAIDADADVAPSLADRPEFAAAMRQVASDHLASVWVDLPGLAGLGRGTLLGGYGAAALAVTAEADGLHLGGTAIFDARAASNDARAAFKLGVETSSLAAWMPRTTSAELSLFGLAQSFADLEAALSADAAFRPAADALNQLRAIASLGLGINIDRDLLPLFDGEAALAIERVAADGPHGDLILHPADSAAAHQGLERVRSALASRGSQTSAQPVAGTSVTTIVVPGIGSVAYAELDGVVLIGLDADDVAAALEAHAAGTTLASDGRYGRPFELAGGRAGNEVWADLASLADGLAGIFDLGSELRDILHQIGELAISASANDDRLEINGVLTLR